MSRLLFRAWCYACGVEVDGWLTADGIWRCSQCAHERHIGGA